MTNHRIINTAGPVNVNPWPRGFEAAKLGFALGWGFATGAASLFAITGAVLWAAQWLTA